MTRTETRTRTVTDVAPSVVRDRRLAGLALFALGAGFVTVVMLAAAMVPGYDLNAAAISDLGVLAETALLFNATLVAVGLLNVAAGYLLYRHHGRVGLLIPFVLAGLGAIGAGVFTLDDAGVHGLFALLAFVFFNVQALVLARRFDGPMRYVSAALGVVGLVFVVVMAVGDAGNTAVFGPIGHGGTERLIVYPPMVWAVAVGGYLLASDAGDTLDVPDRRTPE